MTYEVTLATGEITIVSEDTTVVGTTPWSDATDATYVELHGSNGFPTPPRGRVTAPIEQLTDPGEVIDLVLRFRGRASATATSAGIGAFGMLDGLGDDTYLNFPFSVSIPLDGEVHDIELSAYELATVDYGDVTYFNTWVDQVRAGGMSLTGGSAQGTVAPGPDQYMTVYEFYLAAILPGDPPAPPAEEHQDCACGDDFRIEACDLRTGTVRAVLEPTSAEWQTIFKGFGKGNMSLPAATVNVRDVWPHLTSVYITRIRGGNATLEDPVVEFAGYVEALDADDQSGAVVGLQEITEYLMHRLIRTDLTYTARPQTEIAVALVEYAAAGGIPLTAVAAPSTFPRDRAYVGQDRRWVGAAIIELSQMVNGMEWEVRHTKTDGRWASEIVFADHIGGVRNLLIQSNVDAAGYALKVDATEHATLVDGIGEVPTDDDTEDGTQIVTATDAASIYPRFDAAPSFSDISATSTLEAQTEGYLDLNKEPEAIPSVVIAGLDIDPDDMRNGDVVQVNTNSGVITYRGPGRIQSQSWSLAVDREVQRTYDLEPLTPASESVLNQVPIDDCPDC